MTDARRAIPSVERLLASDALRALLEREPRAGVVLMLREIQAELRATENGTAPVDPAWYAAEVQTRLERQRERSLREVINATGVVLHTNLGRAPLSTAALAAMMRVSRGYSNLEYDVASGARGSRYIHCERLLQQLTGAESALVVNNNAAALVLAFNTLALGQRVVVSRGELIEIGDSFRVAEIIARSGAILQEVGATNRTHRPDYAEQAKGAAALLKVHRSNFRTSGFVAEVSADELAGLARETGIPLVHDLGSGLLESLDDLGLPHEPTAAQVLAAGCDVVTMSGDKLLGGPQAGIILGSADLIAQMKRNPLCRAVRVDKFTIAALEATLLTYARGAARAELPVLRMIATPPSELRQRAERFAALLGSSAGGVELVPGFSKIGGGAYPDADLPTTLIAITVPDNAAARMEALLRAATPPVITRVSDGRVLIDLRTVLPEQESTLADALIHAG